MVAKIRVNDITDVVTQVEKMTFQDGDLLIMYASRDVVHSKEALSNLADTIKQVTPETIKVIIVDPYIDFKLIPKELKREWLDKLLAD